MKSKFQKYLYYFQIEDEEYDLFPITNSHINDTYSVRDKKGTNRYIIQRINSYVFPQPEKVMENIVLVTEHIRKKTPLQRSREAIFPETLMVIPTKEGKSYLKIDGDYIRMYDFIQEGYSCDRITNPEEFKQVAVAIGRFHKMLEDIDISKLHVTIPDFHNTPKRLEGFKKVVQEDPVGRAKSVWDEIEFILQRESLAKAFEGKAYDGTDGLKLRVTHNDTKPANVMLDKHTGQALCMIDLDTVMPGVICDDFGDAIRSGTCRVREEVGSSVDGTDTKSVIKKDGRKCIGLDLEKDRETSYFDEELYHVFYEAFLTQCGEFLTPMEIKMLPVGAMKITYEQALRFLEDYLKGDVYFKVADEEQNLRRARVQMNLLKEMEEKLR